MRNEPLLDDKLIREVERFLYREVRLLDERRFHEWLQLFTDDVRYFMVNRSNRYPKSSKAIAILDPERYVEDDVGREDELAILDEDKATLAARVARLDTGMAWAEDPPSRTRHFLANIEIEPGDGDSEVNVYSNFLVYPAGRKPNRISMSAPAGMCCVASTATGRSRAAGWCSTRPS